MALNEKQKLNCALYVKLFGLTKILIRPVLWIEFHGILKGQIVMGFAPCDKILFMESLILAQNERWRRG